jgi:hypothetical protein
LGRGGHRFTQAAAPGTTLAKAGASKRSLNIAI